MNLVTGENDMLKAFFTREKTVLAKTEITNTVHISSATFESVESELIIFALSYLTILSL